MTTQKKCMALKACKAFSILTYSLSGNTGHNLHSDSVILVLL